MLVPARLSGRAVTAQGCRPSTAPPPTTASSHPHRLCHRPLRRNRHQQMDVILCDLHRLDLELVLPPNPFEKFPGVVPQPFIRKQILPIFRAPHQVVSAIPDRVRPTLEFAHPPIVPPEGNPSRMKGNVPVPPHLPLGEGALYPRGKPRGVRAQCAKEPLVQR
jgi:hypothetical protein